MPRGTSGLRAALALLALVPVSRAAPPPEVIEIPPDAATVLDETSYWRWREVSRSPVIPVAALKAAGLPADKPRALPGLFVDSRPPSRKWRRPDYDDGRWPRGRGRNFGNLIFSKLHLGAVCLRGKFHCADLRRESWKPRLYLTATYRGGIVVYLNGTEVARGGMPKGDIEPDTPARPYPDDLFLTQDGKPFIFPTSYQRAQRIKAGDQDLVRRYKGRDRVLRPVRIDWKLLRRGANVLAVELHRSPYHYTALGWSKNNRNGPWAPCNLLRFRLALDGRGITPNTARPKRRKVWKKDGTGQVWTDATQVWTVDRNNRVALYDYGDPNEKLQPIRLAGARNGVFSGQVVVGSDRAFRGLKATAGALKHADGRHGIPASNVQVRYHKLVHYSYRAQFWFDQLLTDPPAECPFNRSADGAIQPIFVTVHVPRDAAPGDYTGELAVSCSSLGPVAVPIRLSVAAWTLPDPDRYRAYAGIYQSPETLSMYYKVPMWSEKHWQLIEQSFRVLGYVGSDFVHVPLVNRAQCGNDEGWVYWIRKADGTYDYDFTVFDRYAALIKKHLKQPDFICLHVFRSLVYDSTPALTNPHHVTQIDPKTGKRTPLRVPAYATKESLAFWKPVLLRIKERLAKLGLAKSICWGVMIEGGLPRQLTEFARIIPEAGWVKGAHAPTTATRPIPMRGGNQMVLNEHAYAVHRVDPTKAFPQIWQTRRVGARFYRGNAERRDLQDYRILCERNLYFKSRGFGRVALDYWPVGTGRGRGKSIYQRWPESSSAQRGVYTFRLGWPGPNGAEPTLRLEAIREGLQESEAAIYVAEAHAKHKAALGDGLAERCRRIIVRRVHYCIERTHQPWGPIFTHVNHFGWRRLNARLFAVAADVAARLDRKDKK